MNNRNLIYTLYGSYLEDSSDKVKYYTTDDIEKLKFGLKALMIPETIFTTHRVEDSSPIPMYWSLEETPLNTRTAKFIERYNEIRKASELVLAMGGVTAV